MKGIQTAEVRSEHEKKGYFDTLTERNFLGFGLSTNLVFSVIPLYFSKTLDNSSAVVIIKR